MNLPDFPYRVRCGRSSWPLMFTAWMGLVCGMAPDDTSAAHRFLRLEMKHLQRWRFMGYPMGYDVLIFARWPATWILQLYSCAVWIRWHWYRRLIRSGAYRAPREGAYYRELTPAQDWRDRYVVTNTSIT